MYRPGWDYSMCASREGVFIGHKVVNGILCAQRLYVEDRFTSDQLLIIAGAPDDGLLYATASCRNSLGKRGTGYVQIRSYKDEHEHSAF